MVGRKGWRSSVVEHSLGKGEVESSSLSVSSRIQVCRKKRGVTRVRPLALTRVTTVSSRKCGSNSVVESQPSKLLVAGPIPVSRSRYRIDLQAGAEK
jgi:hypothetical protein